MRAIKANSIIQSLRINTFLLLVNSCWLLYLVEAIFCSTKNIVRDFVTLIVCAQTPQSEIDADLTPLTKCRLNRHFVIKAE
ncbi:MAG: hypothetical protein EBW71_01980 [Betaproteobacteria bacterium]|nr:hypothetical protein [Betaproteobacteria bacterium]